MNRHEYIIHDFSNAVVEKENLASASHPNCWEVVTYETEYISGSLLLASEESWPRPVTIKPNLSGWYKIYVCLENFGGGFGAVLSKTVSACSLPTMNFLLSSKPVI